MSLEEFIGDDYDFSIGAPRRRRPTGGGGRQPQRSQAMTQRRQQAQELLQIEQPGVVQSGPRIEPLGFPSHTFANGQPTTAVLTVTPLKPFKGKKLVINVGRIGAATAGLVVTVTRWTVGPRDVLGGANPIPVEMFGPLVEGNEVVMDTAGPGIPITLTLAISAAPAAGETVTLSSGLLGLTWA